MKYGNLVVTKMRPYESITFGCFYSVANEPIYGVFCMNEYNRGIGIESTVEKSYKVDLIPVRESENQFPERSWYTDIFSRGMLFKEFDCVSEANKADAFCKIQNDRLAMLREIKNNPNKHIYFTDTKGVKHEFYYNPENNSFFELADGVMCVDEDGMAYASEREMEHILFNLDWEYTEQLTVKFNSTLDFVKDKIKKIVH